MLKFFKIIAFKGDEMKNKFIAAATAGLISLSSSSALASTVSNAAGNMENIGIIKISSHGCSSKKGNNNCKSYKQPKEPNCMVKCYGIAKAGRNDCAAKNGSHGCAGEAKVSCGSGEWVAMKASECVATTCTTTENGKKVSRKGTYKSCFKK